MAKIKAWSDHIIRHFWYCSNACKESENTSDEEALQIMKVAEILNGYNLFCVEYFYIAHCADCLLKTFVFKNGARRPDSEMSHLRVALWDLYCYLLFFLFSIILLEQVDWPTASCL